MCYTNMLLCFVQVQEARQNHDDEAVKKAVNDYDEALERLVLCGLLLRWLSDFVMV